MSSASPKSIAPNAPHQLGFSSGFGLVVHAIGFIFVYWLFYLRDWVNRSHSIAARILGWILSGFYATGSYLSSDFPQRWGTQEELLQRFHNNEKMPRLEFNLRFRHEE